MRNVYGFSGTAPVGNWLLTNQDATERYATFDFSMESPFNSDGTAKIYIPSLKITTDAENEISAINVQWMLYDQDSEAYVVVTDLEDLWSSVTEARLDVNVQTGETWGDGWSISNFNLLENQTTEIVPGDNYFLNQSVENGNNVVWISIRYTFNGARFIHDWTKMKDN